MSTAIETGDRKWYRNSSLLSALALTVPAFLIAGGRDFRDWQVIILWCGVFLMAGGLTGFLFGIPSGRPVEPKGARDDESFAPAASVNTNLEAIADWLTKILVGLALVSVKDLPEQLKRLTSYVSQGLSGKGNEPFLMALVIYFSLAGFVIGILSTRVYFRLISSPSGSKVVAGLTGDLEAALARKIEQALSGPVLVNYEGCLCVSVEQGGSRVTTGEGMVSLPSRSGSLRFQAWLQPATPADSHLATASVSVRNGEDRDEAEFEIRVDSDEFRLMPQSATVKVRHGGESGKVEFNGLYEFKAGATPAHADPPAAARLSLGKGPVVEDDDDTPPAPVQHPLWLMLFQQNRLVQTITLDFQTPSESNASIRPQP